jgi:hypothetical protein
MLYIFFDINLIIENKLLILNSHKYIYIYIRFKLKKINKKRKEKGK